MHRNVFKDSLGLISHYLNLPCVPWQALGQVGVVIKEFSNGDVRVAVNGKRWIMNPCCLLPAPDNKSIVTPDTGTTTIMIQTVQLSEHPPFWLIIVFQAFEHPRLKLLFQYPNTYTLRSSNGSRQTSTSLQQSLRSYSENYQTSSSILQAFSNI